MALEITSIAPGYARAGDSLTIAGTDFSESPSETEIYFRLSGESWQQVDPSRVTYVSSTELTIAIDSENTDGWEEGWQDIGVCAYEGGSPTSYIEAVVHFFEEDHMATITDVKPRFGEAADSATIVGAGFVDAPSLSLVFVRPHGETTWTAVSASRIAYVSATELTLTLHATEFDEGGLWDVGVADAGDEAPDESLACALYFYTAGADNPDSVVVGPIDQVYIDGRYCGDLAEEVAWSVRQDMTKIFTQHSRAPVKAYPGEEEHEITLPLAEASMENLADLFGTELQDLGDGRRRVTFGGQQTIVDRDLLLIAPGVEGKQCALGFYRCNIALSGSITFGKDGLAAVPLQVTALEDTSRAYGDRIGYFEEFTTA